MGLPMTTHTPSMPAKLFFCFFLAIVSRSNWSHAKQFLTRATLGIRIPRLGLALWEGCVGSELDGCLAYSPHLTCGYIDRRLGFIKTCLDKVLPMLPEGFLF